MVQLAPAAPGQPFGHRSYVPDMAYAYDVAHRNGHFVATVEVIDLETVPHVIMGTSGVCPFPWGACVSSAAGGDVQGYDMYGQYVEETLAAGVPGVIAFAAVIGAPADIAWTNVYGLPYAYVADDDDTPVDITITGPDADGDHRGTFVYAGDFTDSGHATVTVAYQAAVGNLMGDPYSTHETNVVGSVDVAVTGTIEVTGVVTLTIPAATAGFATGFTVTFPDGHTMRGNLGVSPLTHTLSPIWMSQYARNIGGDAAALDRLVAIGFDDTRFKGLYADLTGSLVAGTSEPLPDPEPPAVLTPVPASFGSHANADAWLAEYIALTGFDTPDEWGGATLTTKRDIAQALYEHWQANHT